MTDAERIAEYMRGRHVQGEQFTADDALALAAQNPSGQCGSLLAMLSDVRREEREALAARRCPHCGRSDLHEAICAAVLSEGLCPVNGFRVEQ
jgi:hypothetical protein